MEHLRSNEKKLHRTFMIKDASIITLSISKGERVRYALQIDHDPSERGDKLAQISHYVEESSKFRRGLHRLIETIRPLGPNSDFSRELLDDWNVNVPSWKYPRNLESPRVSSPGFDNDSKIMVIYQYDSFKADRVQTHIGLYARRSVRCVPLTATHCRLRLTWSREHALWTPQQWSCEMFSDKSTFSLQSDSRRTLIWRVSDTRYHQENTIE
ncbi:HTH_Tnp_Tc3_2 domain-containing protein [Trichonephila clavipes]|nr:HTH_Tnp_Tc3_2 domain-containing protein [Trichonephila clavipes]